jgi:raffinose/stachyose/melibiose transport system permease protein
MSASTIAATPDRRRLTPGRAGVGFLLWGYAVFALLPLLLMVIGSLRPNNDLLRDPAGIPAELTFDNFVDAWTTGNFAQYFGNSVLITVGSVAITVVVATLASYALARSKSRVIQAIEAVFLSGLVMPLHLAVLPIFFLFEQLGLIDSRLGLTLLYAASGVAFATFVLTTFFRQLPVELEEAAALDGANALTTFLRILVPLVRPAIATVAVFQFVPIWNDFFFPLVLLRTQSNYPLPVGLSTFFGEHESNYAVAFAGLVITTIPLIVLFLVATKQIVAGLTAGMSK